MDNLNDLKEIWLKADVNNLPDPDEVVRMAKKFRDQRFWKKVFLITAALLLTALEILVGFVYKSTMLTTRLGEGCIVIAGLMLVFTNLRSIGRFYRFKDYNNKDFIKFLEQTRINQLYYYKNTQVIAFCLCAVGLTLYLFETAYHFLIPGLVIYSISMLCLLILWLVVRPRAFKKQSVKIAETIKRLENISNQIK